MKKTGILLILLVVAVFSMAVGAYASANLQAISASLNKGLKINLQGAAWTPKDAKGSAIAPITYNSTTYLPLRSVGEALGLEIKFDSKTQTIFLGKEPDGSYKDGSFMLYDVTVEESMFGWNVEGEVKNIGQKKITGTFTITFFGEDGKRIGSASGVVNEIDVLKTRTTNFLTTDDLKGYKSLRFQVDTEF